MRAVVIVALLVAFTGLALYVQHYLVRSGELMAEAVQAIIDATRTSDWEAGKREAKRLLAHWRKTEDRWSVFTEHQEIDDINGSLSRLLAYVAEEDRTAALAEAEAALQLFRHIPGKEALRLVNIL